MYNHFAGIYDELTENVSYSERAEYISGFFHKYSVKRGAKILDLACGTGSFTAEFSRLGYDVTGADISCEMLSFAENKCSGNASFVCADMRDFAFFEPFDACVCCLDSINHLDSINDVAKTFKCVYNSLRPGGIFVFDVNTLYKHENVLGDNTFVFDEDEFFLSWDNEYLGNGKVRLILDMFFRKGKLYERYSEDFCEQAYDIEAIKNALNPLFDIKGIYNELTLTPPKTDSERLYFVCERKIDDE